MKLMWRLRAAWIAFCKPWLVADRVTMGVDLANGTDHSAFAILYHFNREESPHDR